MDAVLKKEFVLEGLCCPNCAAKIEKRVGALPGVSAASVDFAGQRLMLEIARPSEADGLLAKALSIVKDTEPDIVMREKKSDEFTAKRDESERGLKHVLTVKRVALGLGVLLFAAGLIFTFTRPVELAIFLAAFLLIGGEVIWHAVRNIAKGQIFDENFLMSLATVGAFAIGEYPEGVAVMLFYQIGEAFQDYAVGRSRKSIESLMDIRPDFANLQTSQGLRRVAPEEVHVGDVIVVKPGEKIPLDGVVLDGYSVLDTSSLTGESMPRDASPGCEVLSGSINKNGLLTIETRKEFGESTVSKILALVQNASGAKAPIENFITKFARYYTPAVVIAAVLLAFVPSLFFGASLSEWVYRALVFLVVSCPCALVVSIPLSFFGGIGAASRSGILVKGSQFLEALKSVETVVFDKTGTLTKGVFSVTKMVPANGFTQSDLIKLAAYTESGSTHPIANSIQKAYGKPIESTRITQYEEIAGHGIRACVDGKSVLAGNRKLLLDAGIETEQANGAEAVVYLACDGVYAGCLVIADEVKADSLCAIQELKSIGVKKTVMLTGDTTETANQIARGLGLDEIYAELLPHQKVQKLETLLRNQSGKGKLIFVGDGINDAPVLARADVGMAMGGVGSDAAIEAADVVLMTDEPSKIGSAIRIAKKTQSIVWQNIVFALGVKAVILALGALGIASMWTAVFGDVGVALIAVLNAMRALSPATTKIA